MIRTFRETQYIQKLVSEGEHEQQDFKFEISDARKIARSISAFANTRGGRLLVGIKDNGKIAGIRSEEEIYMIEAAAQMYCKPLVKIDMHTHVAEGKNVLEVLIEEATGKPVYAIDEQNNPKAYIRIKDENILATPVHLKVWKQAKTPKGTLLAFTEKEQHLLNILRDKGCLTLNECCRMSRNNRTETCILLADFIRFGLVIPIFQGHKFYFKLNED